MPKTHYLGETKAGAIVARASTQRDYTHAATFKDHKPGLVRLQDASFSRSAAGALKAYLGSNYQAQASDAEVVTLRQVDAADYRRTTGKA